MPDDCLCHVRGDFEIVYCPLHAAAPDLLNALNQTAKLAHKSMRNHNEWISFRECSHATCKTAGEVIRKAEGR